MIEFPIALEIDSVLHDIETQRILQVFESIGAVDFLVLFPFQKISLLKQIIVANFQVNGLYNYRTQECEMSVSRGTHEFGQQFSYQNVYSISSLATNEFAAIQRTAIHELGHHIHNRLRNTQLPFFRRTMQIPRVFSISQYAAKDNLEYFAESFAAFVFCQDQLMHHDQIGYNMIIEALGLLELQIKELL